MGGKFTKKHSINKENNFFKSQNKYRKKIILVGASLVKFQKKLRAPLFSPF